MPDTTTGQDAYQLAFIDLGFQVVGVFLNIIVLLFENVMTSVFTGIFNVFKGVTL
jgi:hypothetical protein